MQVFRCVFGHFRASGPSWTSVTQFRLQDPFFPIHRFLEMCMFANVFVHARSECMRVHSVFVMCSRITSPGRSSYLPKIFKSHQPSAPNLLGAHTSHPSFVERNQHGQKICRPGFWSNACEFGFRQVTWVVELIIS